MKYIQSNNRTNEVELKKKHFRTIDEIDVSYTDHMFTTSTPVDSGYPDVLTREKLCKCSNISTKGVSNQSLVRRFGVLNIKDVRKLEIANFMYQFHCGH